MAFGDFLDLKEAACVAAQRASSDAGYLTLAGNYVNEAYLELMGMSEVWSFALVDGQVTLTAGTGDYLVNGATSVSSTLGYGTDGVEEVRDLVLDSASASGELLKRMPWRQLEDLALSTQDGDSSGVPVAWSVTGERLRVWPAPDQAYVLGVHVRRRASALSGDTDTPLVPLAFRRPILARHAAARLLHAEGGAEARSEAGQLEGKAEQAIQALMRRYASARDGVEFRVIEPGYMADLDAGWQPAAGGL